MLFPWLCRDYVAFLNIVMESVPITRHRAKRGHSVVLQSLWGFVRGSRGVYVVESRGRCDWLTPLGLELWTSGRVTTTAPADDQPSNQTEASSSITNVHSQTNLIFKATGQEGVIEVHNDIIGGPWHSDQAEHTGTEKAPPSTQSQWGLDRSLSYGQIGCTSCPALKPVQPWLTWDRTGPSALGQPNVG